MSNHFYPPDDPTQPVRPQSSQQGQQGKLVIGSFHNEPQSPSRRPYQYPPQQSPQRSSHASASPKPPAAYPVYPQPGKAAPASHQNARYPSPPFAPRKRRGNGCLIAMGVVVALVLILGVFLVSTAQRLLAFGSAISTQSPLSTQTNYIGISDRTNLLVMGYGGAGHDGAYLTESLLVVSVLPQSHHTSLISIPRDLLVQVPEGSGQYGKINSVYEVGSNFGKDPVAGGDAAAKKIQAVTGQPVKYWMTINFTGFKEVIDSLGGVDVNVPDSFNACYPKNDDANVDASWIKVQFNKGVQHMDGATAIEYARAREPLEVCGKGTSENLAELTDFGRSARQQIIVKAVLSKVKQISTWPKFIDAMTALQHTIYTNLSLADLTEFALKMDMNDPHTARIGVSTSNVLAEDGSYNLHPINGNWQAIAAYINQHLYN